jgi:ankyrin repeat protein
MDSLGNILRPKTENEIESSLKNMSEDDIVESAKNNPAVLDLIINNDWLSAESYGILFIWCIKIYNKHCALKLLTKNISKEYVNLGILELLKHNNRYVEIGSFLNSLIEDKRADISSNRNELFRWAAKNGQLSVVTKLLENPKVDPSDINNQALLAAETYEYKNIVNILLKDPRVRAKLTPQQMAKYKIRESLGDILKPKSEDEVKQAALEIKDPNELLRTALNKIGSAELVKIAIQRGADPNKVAGDVSNIKNPEIIRILLTDPQTKVAPNSLVYKALKFGLEDEVIKLLKDDKLNPGAKNSIILVWAVGFGLKKLTQALLKDERVKPEAEEESIAEALSIAIARGNNDITRILIGDDRINTGGDYNRPIKVAAQFGNVEAVKLLLANPKVDPSQEDLSTSKPNYAIAQAAENGHVEIVELLLQDKRVKDKLTVEELKKYEDIMKKKIVRESLVETVAAEPAQPTTKPGVKPGVKPGTKPGAPSPIRRERPSVTPKPKASADDVAEKFLGLIEEEPEE